MTKEEIHKREMEDGGFTFVSEGADNLKSGKHKVSDGKITTMHGISREEA